VSYGPRDRHLLRRAIQHVRRSAAACEIQQPTYFVNLTAIHNDDTLYSRRDTRRYGRKLGRHNRRGHECRYQKLPPGRFEARVRVPPSADRGVAPKRRVRPQNGVRAPSGRLATGREESSQGISVLRMFTLAIPIATKPESFSKCFRSFIPQRVSCNR
jgi:hypothetical protein